jgi:hypothetical protein
VPDKLLALADEVIEQACSVCCPCSGLELMWWTAPAPGDESP